jgi:hypothetical protein
MELIGSSDPEFEAFSKEYDNIGLAAPERHILVAEINTLNYLDTPLT